MTYMWIVLNSQWLIKLDQMRLEIRLNMLVNTQSIYARGHRTNEHSYLIILTVTMNNDEK